MRIAGMLSPQQLEKMHGVFDAPEELAAVLEANSAEPLPAWFSALVVKSLRGELKKKRGRPKDENPLSSIRFQIAMAKYHQYLILAAETRTLCWAGRMVCRPRQNLVGRTRPTNVRPEWPLRAGFPTSTGNRF